MRRQLERERVCELRGLFRRRPFELLPETIFVVWLVGLSFVGAYRCYTGSARVCAGGDQTFVWYLLLGAFVPALYYLYSFSESYEFTGRNVICRRWPNRTLWNESLPDLESATFLDGRAWADDRLELCFRNARRKLIVSNDLYAMLMDWAA
jgi:hypothetical protein